jgi:hypothetical protein
MSVRKGSSSFIFTVKRRIRIVFMWRAFRITLRVMPGILISGSRTFIRFSSSPPFHSKLFSGFQVQCLWECFKWFIVFFVFTICLCFTVNVGPRVSYFLLRLFRDFPWVSVGLFRTFFSCSKSSLSLSFVALWHLSAVQYVISWHCVFLCRLRRFFWVLTFVFWRFDWSVVGFVSVSVWQIPLKFQKIYAEMRFRFWGFKGRCFSQLLTV